MSKLIQKKLTHIIDSKYVSKVNKYVIRLGIGGEPKETVWLSSKQMNNLLDCFSKTAKGYSDKHISIIGHWNEKGYYAYTSYLNHKKNRSFTKPVQYDLGDLYDES